MASSKKKATWSEVRCNTHGKSSPDPNIPVSLRVGAKGIRAEKTAGCPLCKKEANKK